MDVGATIRRARQDAGLTQAELAERAGTSQATISAYEAGRKDPSATTLARVLAAAGARLTSEPRGFAVGRPTRGDLEDRARILAQVLDLAEALPFRRAPDLDYPRLPA